MSLAGALPEAEVFAAPARAVESFQLQAEAWFLQSQSQYSHRLAGAPAGAFQRSDLFHAGLQ